MSEEKLKYFEYGPETKPNRPFYTEEQLGEVFGDHETMAVPVDELVILPQVRSKSNAVRSELEKSIEDHDILNRINIAIMTPDQLSEHLDFVNGIWGTKARMEDYGEPNNGVYPVVIAGHSRTESLKSIQNRPDRSGPVSISCNIHHVESPMQFLSLQLAENTYDGVSPERKAMAVVEMFSYGYDVNATPDDKEKWSSYSDFVKKNPGDISTDLLSDAMAFAKLPQGVRGYIFEKELFYSAGVELGRNADTVEQYVKYYLGDEADEKEAESSFGKEMVIILNQLIKTNNPKISAKKQIEKIRTEVRKMREALLSEEEKAKNQQLMLDNFLDAPNVQARQYKNSLDAEYRRSISVLKTDPSSGIIESLRLATALTGVDHSDDIAEVERFYQMNIGAKAISIAGSK